MADRIKELVQQGERAQAEIEELDQQIATGVADGLDEHSLEEMRHQRRRLIENSDDIAGAIALLETRQNDPNEKNKAADAAKARKDARKKAEEYVAAAVRVDSAIEAVEVAFKAMRQTGQDLTSILRTAGLGDNAKISNSLMASSRWALWAGAPTICEMANVAYTNNAKRVRLAESARRVVPRIPE